MHNQGISRQTPFFQTALQSANPPAGWGGPAVERTKCVPRKIPLLAERIQVRASVITNLPLSLKNPPSRHDQGSIKAKTPLIVHNQGISRQTPFFRNALHTANPPAGWGGPAVERTKHVPEKIPLLGERIQVRASVITNLPLSLKTRHQGTIKAQSRQKPL